MANLRYAQAPSAVQIVPDDLSRRFAALKHGRLFGPRTAAVLGSLRSRKSNSDGNGNGNGNGNGKSPPTATSPADRVAH